MADRPSVDGPNVATVAAETLDAIATTPGTAQVLQPGAMVGEYQIDAILGEGGMGTVYKGLHPVIGKHVAIKILSPMLCQDATMLERFLQEARVVNAIRHPNIVDIFNFGKLQNGQAYLVMEWLDGETLDQRMNREPPVSVDEAIGVMLPMIEALHVAHQTGVVHRDLKPANIFLVAQHGRTIIKLLDFGIAKLLGDGDLGYEATPTTKTGFILGTPGYLAPEQARGQKVGSHSDVYSLGVLLYILLLKQKPFEAENFIDLLHKQLHVGATPPREVWPDIPPVLENLLLGMLHTDPKKRPTLPEVKQTLSDARAKLQAAGNPTTLEVDVEGSGGTIQLDSLDDLEVVGPGPKSGPPLGLIALAVAGVVALAGAWIWLSSSDDAAEPPAVAGAVGAPSATGTLRVETGAADAKIFIDGVLVATGSQQVEATVDAGSPHVVAVAISGQKPVSETVTIAADSTTTVSLTPVVTNPAAVPPPAPEVAPEPEAESAAAKADKKPVKKPVKKRTARKRKKPAATGAAKKPGRKSSDGDYTLNPFQ